MNVPARRWLAAAATTAFLVRASLALAEDGPSAAAIRAARDALRRRPEFRYAEAAREKSFFERLFDAWQEFLDWLRTEHPVLFAIAAVGLVVTLAALVAHLLWTWHTARRARFAGIDVDALEAALRNLDPAPFRERALAAAAAGRLDEAIRELYTALLLTMDRRGAVRYARSKALLDYRIESLRDPPARAVLERFVDAYPPGSFGRRPPDAARFRELVAALDGLAAAPAAPAAQGAAR